MTNVYPNGGSSWTMRLQATLLFPKLSMEQEKMIVEQKLKQLEQSPPKQRGINPGASLRFGLRRSSRSIFSMVNITCTAQIRITLRD